MTLVRLRTHILFALLLFLALPLKAAELEDHPVSYQTLKSVYPELENLMSPDTRQAFIRFLGYLESLGGKDSIEQELLRQLLILLKHQSDTDLPWFTSHNAGHSLRVLQKIQSVMTENPEYLTWIYRRYALYAYPQKYEIAMFLGSFIALVHDVGYSEFGDLGNARKTPKYIHARLGANIVKRQLFEPLVKLLPEPVERRQELKTAVYYAVRYHNADDAKSHHIDIKGSESSTAQERWDFYGTAPLYLEAVAKDDPFLVLIRVADNLDFSRKRLFTHQRSELYLRLLDSIQNVKRSKGDERGGESWVNTLRSHYLEQLQSTAFSQKFANDSEYLLLQRELEAGYALEFPPSRLSLLTTSLLTALPGDFPHIYSNYIVDSVHYQRSVGGRYRVYVEFGEDVLESSALERNYQLKRMADALVSCILPSRRLVDLVYVSSPSLAGGKDIPLSAFSRLTRSDNNLRLIELRDVDKPDDRAVDE